MLYIYNLKSHFFSRYLTVAFMYRHYKQIIQCKNKLDGLLVLSKYSIRHRVIYRERKNQYDKLLKAEKIKSYESRVKRADNKVVW